MYNTQFNSLKINYLLNCDTISKYLLKNSYHIPSIKKINIQFSLKELLLISDYINKDTLPKNLQLKGLLFFYLNFSSLPYVSFYTYKNSKALKDRNDGDFIIKYSISNKTIINHFLKEIKTQELIWQHSKKIFNLKQTIKKNQSYNLAILGVSFEEINKYFQKSKSSLNINGLNIQLNFVYKENIKKDYNKINIIKTNSLLG